MFEKKVGLALGGGAALGAAHIGVLKALEEHDVTVDYISGTSIGAFIAALVAFGKGWRDIKEFAEDLNWLDVAKITLSQYGLLSNNKLAKLLTDNIGDVDFDRAEIPLAVVATDITCGEKVVLKEGNVARAVVASTCIPGIFVPVEIDGRLLVDGGLVENVPVSPLEKMGADIVIAVDLSVRFKSEKPQNIIDVLMRSFDFAIKKTTELRSQNADHVIRPDLSDFNLVDTDQKDELIDRGYTTARKVLDKVARHHG